MAVLPIGVTIYLVIRHFERQQNDGCQAVLDADDVVTNLKKQAKNGKIPYREEYNPENCAKYEETHKGRICGPKYIRKTE